MVGKRKTGEKLFKKKCIGVHLVKLGKTAAPNVILGPYE